MNLDLFRIIVVIIVALSPIFILRPKLLIYCYLALLFYFPNVGWGVAENEQVFNLYGKGTGVLPLPLINIVLYFVFLLSLLRLYPEKEVRSSFNLRIYFWGINVLLLMFFSWGLMSGVELSEIISSRGLINLFNMSVLSVVIIRAFSNNNELQRLGNFIVFCALTRGLWGLVRLVLMGGDPANVYFNVQAIDVQITFFDINDSLISAFSLFFSAWMLMNCRKIRPALPSWKKIAYFLAIIVGLLIIILSHRRTSWGGLALVGLWFVWLQPWHKRFMLGIVAGVLGLLIVTQVVTERFSTISSTKGNSGILYDVLSKKGKLRAEGRLAEFALAWKHISEAPLTGVKPWGAIDRGKGHDFIHSGFLHLWLKGGFFVLLFFCLMLLAYTLFALLKLKKIPPDKRGLGEAAFACILFLTPTLMFGTPFIEFRTTQMMGLMLALPYLVYGVWLAEEKSKLARANAV